MDSLRTMISEAVSCHSDDSEAPRVVRLQAAV